jgi:glycerate 2-kinase
MIRKMTDPSQGRGAGRAEKILLAPDSFKGTLTATEVIAALAGPLREAGFEVEACPLADGGEGTAEALLAAAGGRRVEADAHDPLGRPLRSWYALLADGERARMASGARNQPRRPSGTGASGFETAVVETAAASGLNLIAPSERDPEAASTYGTGELIVAAADRVQTILVGVGGSAATDGGRGALQAIRDGGGIDGTRIVCLCDVRIPWELAARVFAPQKGADEVAVARLSARLEELAARLPRDPRGVARTGAAGGLAGGMWAQCGAELVDGARFVADRAGLEEGIGGAVAVMTGEGRLDATTLEGKAVSEVARRAERAGVPVHAVVGEDATTAAERRALGISSVHQASTAEEIADAAGVLARDLRTQFRRR